MKRMIAMLLMAALILVGAALAEDYASDEMTFTYEPEYFEITTDDQTDDEQLVVLTGKDAAWGVTELHIHVREMEDGEAFPTLEAFAATVPDAEVAQVDWNRYRGAFIYTLDNGDSTETVIVAPVRDDDDEIENVLTIRIIIAKTVDEDAGMDRDDMISNVLSTLRIDD